MDDGSFRILVCAFRIPFLTTLSFSLSFPGLRWTVICILFAQLYDCAHSFMACAFGGCLH